MVEFFKKNQEKIFQFALIFLISSLGVFVLVNSAQAYVGEQIEQGFLWLISKFCEAIISLLGIIITWVIGLLKGVMELGNPQHANVVKIGWTIVRDITNMFFILILLVIAFATILRKESYGMKALLPKLIGIALLINFSLVLAGVVINFADGVTGLFLQDAKFFDEYLPRALGLPGYIDNTGEVDELDIKEVWKCKKVDYKWYSVFTGLAYTNEIALTKEACEKAADGECAGHCERIELNAQNAETIKEELAEIDYTYNMILAMLLSILFMLIAIFVLAAFFFMLIYRVLVLWILLILMPMALLLWVLPATANLFGKWMHTFFRWAFFAPIAVFFLWLSIMSWIRFLEGEDAAPGGGISVGMSDIAKYEMLVKQTVPAMFLPENLFQFILVCGMMVGSLMVAQKMSIYGAGGAMSLGKKWGKSAGKSVGRLGKSVGRMTERGAGRAGLTEKVQTGLQKTVGRVPVARRALRPLRGRIEAQRGQISEAQKKYESWSDTHLYNQFKTANAYEKVGIAKQLAQRGKLQPNKEAGFTDKDVSKVVDYAHNFGQEKEILESRPDLAINLAPKIGKSKQEAVDSAVKGLKPENIKNLQKGTLEVPEVKQAILKQFQEGGKFTKNYLSEVAKTNQEVYNTINNEILKPNYNSVRNDIKQYLNKQEQTYNQEESRRQPFIRGRHDQGGLEQEGEVPAQTKGSVKDDIADYLRREGPKDPEALKLMGSLRPGDVADLSRNLSPENLSSEVKQSMVDQFKEDGGWYPSHLSSLAQNNPDMYIEIKEELDKNFTNLRKDVKDYLKNNPEKIVLENK